MKKTLIIFIALITHSVCAQRLGINTVEPQATLDVVDNNAGNNRGIIFPQLTSEQIKAMTAPVPGQMVYNTTLNCLMLFSGETFELDGASVPQWHCKSNAAADTADRKPKARSGTSLMNMLKNTSALGSLLPNKNTEHTDRRSTLPRALREALERRGSMAK